METVERIWIKAGRVLVQTRSTDPSIPSDDEMTERRPDLVVDDRLCKSIFIIEMSVPTDSNLNGRWQEKFQKYQKLAADMRKQFWGYRIKVVN